MFSPAAVLGVTSNHDFPDDDSFGYHLASDNEKLSNTIVDDKLQIKRTCGSC